MKLIVTQFADHWDVTVHNGFTKRDTHVFTFDTKQEARAFCDGFFCAKSVINSLVQSLPLAAEYKTK